MNPSGRTNTPQQSSAAVPPLPLETSPRTASSSGSQISSTGFSSLSQSNSTISLLATSALTPQHTPPPPVLPTPTSLHTPRNPKTESEDNSSGSESVNWKLPPKPKEPGKQITQFTVHAQANTFWNPKNKQTAKSQAYLNAVDLLERKSDAYARGALSKEEFFTELKRLDAREELKDALPTLCNLIDKLKDNGELYKYIISQTVIEEKAGEKGNPLFRENRPGISLLSYMIRRDINIQFKNDEGWPFSEMAAQSIIAMDKSPVFGKTRLKMTKELTQNENVKKDMKELTTDYINRVTHTLFLRRGKLLTNETRELCQHFMTCCKEAQFEMGKTLRGAISFERLLFATLFGLRCVNAEFVQAGLGLQTTNTVYNNFSVVFMMLASTFQASLNVLSDPKATVDEFTQSMIPSLDVIINCLLLQRAQPPSPPAALLKPPSVIDNITDSMSGLLGRKRKD